MNADKKHHRYLKTYGHATHGTIRRVWLNVDWLADVRIGRMSRRAAKRWAAREIHAENVFNTTKGIHVAAGLTEYQAEIFAAGHNRATSGLFWRTDCYVWEHAEVLLWESSKRALVRFGSGVTRVATAKVASKVEGGIVVAGGAK